ncbi:MAG: hypothetical protein ACR2LN_07955 [Candidatus Levyibacteriota bacterium]
MKYLALTLPNGQTVQAPSSVPTGGLSKVSQVIGAAVTIMIIITAILCLFVIVWAGIQWTTSGGDKQKVTAARARITYAIIGLIVALASFFFVNVLANFFGFKVLGS